MHGGNAAALDKFQSTPSVGRATLNVIYYEAQKVFQSTPSVGRATSETNHKQPQTSYFNPRPPWGGRHTPLLQHIYYKNISIHALRGEGDQ